MSPPNEDFRSADYRSLHFICESVSVAFRRPPALEKKPDCPEAFTWGGRVYRIVELLNEWSDYRRRGRMAHNMRPEHAATAERRGSRGVGRRYFRIRVENGQVFDLCYDRAPKNVRDRKGSWFLIREMVAADRGN